MKLNLTQIIEFVVIFIAAGSFIISYNNLHESALLMGIPAIMAIIFPLTIDAFLIVCTLYVLYAGRKCKPTWEGWLFLVLYTIASIAFNIHMAPDDWWSRAGFAMCPIGLCIALHFLMRILEIEMGGCEPDSVPVCNESIDTLERDNDSNVISESLEHYPQLQPYHEVSNPFENIPPVELPESVSEIISKSNSNSDIVFQVFSESPGITMVDACKRTGLTYKTVKKHLDKLKSDGKL